MTIKFVYGGDPDRIPKIGEVLPLGPHLNFKVEEYGESGTEEGDLYVTKELCWINLKGTLIIPAGSPMEVLEGILGIERKS